MGCDISVRETFPPHPILVWCSLARLETRLRRKVVPQRRNKRLDIIKNFVVFLDPKQWIETLTSRSSLRACRCFSSNACVERQWNVGLLAVFSSGWIQSAKLLRASKSYISELLYTSESLFTSETRPVLKRGDLFKYFHYTTREDELFCIL